MKKLLTYGLLALAFVGIGFAIKQRVAPTASDAEVSAIQLAETSLPDDATVVTYFTTNARCPSCRKLEDLTRLTVEGRFPEQLASGGIVFRTINTDEAENLHFVEDYQLVSKTVVVSRRKGGEEIEWANLQDIWLKLTSPDELDAYVRSAIQEMLGRNDS